MTLRTLNYGNYGIFLTMGNAGFCPSAVLNPSSRKKGTLIIMGLLRNLEGEGGSRKQELS